MDSTLLNNSENETKILIEYEDDDQLSNRFIKFVTWDVDLNEKIRSIEDIIHFPHFGEMIEFLENNDDLFPDNYIFNLHPHGDFTLNELKDFFKIKK